MNTIVLRILAVALVLTQLEAMAAEGKVSLPEPVPDKDRVSRYSGASVLNEAAAVDGQKISSFHGSAADKPSAVRKIRDSSLMKSVRAADFSFHSTGTSLRSDRDSDGYHAEFRTRFDADVRTGDARVYAKLYLRRVGEDQWFLYHETDDFRISGQARDDEYFVTKTLDDGYPTGEYDVLIDLYESGKDGIAATVTPRDGDGLSYLPLEETGLDVAAAIPGYSIRNVSTELLIDADGDGYYSSFRITFDPDADSGSRLVYARFWVRARGGDWIDEHASEDFWVDSAGSSDAYVVDVDWRSGYPTSLYDFQIDLHDSSTGLLVASAGSDRPALAQVPLEDGSQDVYVSPPTPNPGNDSSDDGGGGALGGWSALSLLALWGLRRRNC
jgi:MYXO-CTERM domain-containing protein